MTNNTITINDTSYEIDSLTDEAKNLIQHIQVIDSELFRLVNVHQSLTAGKQAATAQLIQLVENNEDNDSEVS